MTRCLLIPTEIMGRTGLDSCLIVLFLVSKIEHLIQAADVAHMSQHWTIYRVSMRLASLTKTILSCQCGCLLILFLDNLRNGTNDSFVNLTRYVFVFVLFTLKFNDCAMIYPSLISFQGLP